MRCSRSKPRGGGSVRFLVIDGPGLIVPHPRFRERRFVLEPLAEIAPEAVDPVTGRTIRELLADQPSL